ncbi:hypothetical protein B0H14DRAFT_3466258 [Mycena olivaceomarginata]|nr:hypothetical protein B0H14DRAFT_3466258 [Mycena olivaceomarginata]
MIKRSYPLARFHSDDEVPLACTSPMPHSVNSVFAPPCSHTRGCANVVRHILRTALWVQAASAQRRPPLLRPPLLSSLDHPGPRSTPLLRAVFPALVRSSPRLRARHPALTPRSPLSPRLRPRPATSALVTRLLARPHCSVLALVTPTPALITPRARPRCLHPRRPIASVFALVTPPLCSSPRARCPASGFVTLPPHCEVSERATHPLVASWPLRTICTSNGTSSDRTNIVEFESHIFRYRHHGPYHSSPRPRARARHLRSSPRLRARTCHPAPALVASALTLVTPALAPDASSLGPIPAFALVTPCTPSPSAPRLGAPNALAHALVTLRSRSSSSPRLLPRPHPRLCARHPAFTSALVLVTPRTPSSSHRPAPALLTLPPLPLPSRSSARLRRCLCARARHPVLALLALPSAHRICPRTPFVARLRACPPPSFFHPGSLHPGSRDSDIDGSMPDLEDAGSLSEMETCPYCFDCQHVSALECPLQGISEAMADQLNGMAYPERQALLIKWLESNSSDVLLLPDQSPAVLRGAFEEFVKQNKDAEEDKKKPPADPRIAIDRTSAPPPVFRAGNLSAAACVVPPSFPQRGRVVTRKTWSSSSPSPPNSTDESFEFVRRSREAPPDDSTALEPARWSPIISQWIHEITGNDPSESDISSSAYSAVSSNASTSSGTEDSVDDPPQKVPQYNPPSGEMAELHTALYYWAYDGALRQIDTRHYEDAKGSEPAELALRVVHGSLQRFIDYGAMATDEVWRLRVFAVHPPTPFRPLTPLLTPIENLFTIPDGPLDSSALFTPDASDSSGPNPAQSPTSLDFSLPSPPNEACADLPAIVRYSGSKRKAPDDQKGRRQRTFTFKATGILDANVIRKFAGVRLATIETVRRMEEIVWKLYGISEQSFPTEPSRHPLLHEYELAKMYTVLDVLRRNGRFRLANNLHNLLSIRLRDGYAVSQLLNARFLDANYPEFGEDYHDLLRDANEVSIPPSATTSDRFPVDEQVGNIPVGTASV